MRIIFILTLLFCSKGLADSEVIKKACLNKKIPVCKKISDKIEKKVFNFKKYANNSVKYILIGAEVISSKEIKVKGVFGEEELLISPDKLMISYSIKY
mgnify:CR=1 FL=1|tara:strand:- start:34662 stop:34955 length:294 start_codon:yes stop_codon:yes gene_type:complete